MADEDRGLRKSGDESRPLATRVLAIVVAVLAFVIVAAVVIVLATDALASS
jgi:hypothetical protein